MPENLHTLHAAYDLIGAFYTAPAQDIKKAYRNAIKQWHPDKWATDATLHAEALEKTKRVNAAYALIKNAPLRYHVSTHPKIQEKYNKQWEFEEYTPRPDTPKAAPRATRRPRSRTGPARPIKEYTRFQSRTETITLYVMGALFGFSIIYLFDSVLPPPEHTINRFGILLTYIIFPVCMAWISRTYGSRFWNGVFNVLAGPWRW